MEENFEKKLIDGLTGLKDSNGDEIKEGDTIEWAYAQHGVITKDDKNEDKFLPCLTGGDMVQIEKKERKKIVFEVRKNIAGYFLDEPGGISMTFVSKRPTCKIVKE